MDRQDVLDHAVGFGKLSQWQMYGCEENAVQTLNGFIDEQLPGAVFDAVMQKRLMKKWRQTTMVLVEKKYMHSVC